LSRIAGAAAMNRSLARRVAAKISPGAQCSIDFCSSWAWVTIGMPRGRIHSSTGPLTTVLE